MSDYKRLKEKLETILTLPELPFEEDLTAVDCKQMYDILCKIEQGTLIELPCKVGDVIYQFDNGGEIYESKIRSIYYVKNTFFYDCGFFAFDNTAIGESIFLTKAEAEKKLEELENGRI